jgi:hypothetical protein
LRRKPIAWRQSQAKQGSVAGTRQKHQNAFLRANASPPMNSHVPTFTATQIAAALGKKRQSVARLLEGITADKEVLIFGNLAKAWAMASLPAHLQAELNAEADKQGYRNAEALLNRPPKSWQPPFPLAEIAEHSLERAVKLQRALSPSLQRQNDSALSATEFEKRGLEDYKNVFGHEISARYFRELFKRTVQRDSGAENWSNLALYLDERPARKTFQPIKCAEEFEELQDFIFSFENPSAPSEAQIQLLWLRCFQFCEEMIESGRKPKKAKLAVLKFLEKSAPFLAQTPNALRVSWNRKYERWVEKGRKIGALNDNRKARSMEEIDQEDRDKIIAHAVFKTGGRVSQAWREVRQEIPELDSRYLSNPHSKSYVPRKIREAVKHETALLEDIHHGPRTAKLNGPHLHRDWSKVFSMDWLQSDDCTLPVYYYEEDGNGGYELMRGQLLLMIDLRSTRILEYALLSSRNYTARAIRSLITKTCDEFGLPRRGFYFENGIWKSSRLLKGNAKADPMDWSETELGLRGLGLDFRHAKTPRAKPVERVLGAIQNLMEGMPGYVGRNEMLEKFERVQRAKLDVAARRVHPSEHFNNGDFWDKEIFKICARYNAEKQDGKMTGGLSPDEAFEKFKNVNDPPTRFSALSRYLLADHRKLVKVSRKGEIRLFNFIYRNEISARLAGQTVLTWFSSETPDVLTITDLNRKNPQCIPRHMGIDVMDATPEILSAELGKISAMQSFAKERYRTLKSQYAQQFRTNVIDPDTIELGMEMAARKSEVRKDQHLETKARKVYTDLGAVAPANVHRRSETIEAATELAKMLRDSDESPSEVSPSFNSLSVNPITGKKEYALKTAPPPVTTGQFWALWKKAETIKPGINRHALTQKALGYHPKVNEMSQAELAKMVSVFSAIIRDSKDEKDNQ